jgi:hypothetical protein
MRLTAATFGIGLGVFTAIAQSTEPALEPNHPAIRYASADLNDPVSRLNRRLIDGSASLKFDKTLGYLPALLEELKVPRESQVMVFSKTSLQSMMISPSNPRAILFNDSVAIAFVRGGPILELAANDPLQGTIFYTLGQSPQRKPVLAREAVCLGCHNTAATLGVPGVIAQTVFPKDTGTLVTGLIGEATDHRTPFAERWGGWYVTGKRGPIRHRGNSIVASVSGDEDPTPDFSAKPLQESFNTSGYVAPYSDIVALTLFDHQVRMMNLITRVGWKARIQSPTLRDEAREFVDYLLFVDEAPFEGPIEGTSGFAAQFTALGPFDARGRSLRQFDLQTRLMKYPCSYMIYSDAFGALSKEAKDTIYERLWEILSGNAKDKKYARLSAADRTAIIEILRGTLTDLPAYFEAAPSYRNK